MLNTKRLVVRYLRDIADKIDFDSWYFGHFHGVCDNGKYHMLFENYVEVI